MYRIKYLIKLFKQLKIILFQFIELSNLRNIYKNHFHNLPQKFRFIFFINLKLVNIWFNNTASKWKLKYSSVTKPSGLHYFGVADFSCVLSFSRLHRIFDKFAIFGLFCMVNFFYIASENKYWNFKLWIKT